MFLHMCFILYREDLCLEQSFPIYLERVKAYVNEHDQSRAVIGYTCIHTLFITPRRGFSGPMKQQQQLLRIPTGRRQTSGDEKLSQGPQPGTNSTSGQSES